MKAGRELDILVAEKVMDWVVDGDIIENADFDEQGRCTFPPGDFLMNKETREPLPNYSTNIADAWQVLEKMQDRYQLGLMPTSFGKWVCRGYLPETAKIQVQAEAPLAICLAALKAIGWEDERE